MGNMGTTSWLPGKYAAQYKGRGQKYKMGGRTTSAPQDAREESAHTAEGIRTQRMLQQTKRLQKLLNKKETPRKKKKRTHYRERYKEALERNISLYSKKNLQR